MLDERFLCEEHGSNTETSNEDGSLDVASSSCESWICGHCSGRSSWDASGSWLDWCWGGGWVDGDDGGDDSWDAGRDEDGAQAVWWDNWSVSLDWDDGGGLNVSWWDGGGVVVRWDGGGVEVAGGGGDGALSWAVGDSWSAAGDGNNVGDVEGRVSRGNSGHQGSGDDRELHFDMCLRDINLFRLLKLLVKARSECEVVNECGLRLVSVKEWTTEVKFE